MNKSIMRIAVIALGLVFTVSTFALPGRFDQPFMQAALNDLKDAQNSLKKATADKGGHRERAIDLTVRAIAAVNDGITYDRTHITPRKRNSTNESSDMISAPGIDQPNMVNAREHLQDALKNLNKASADKGGYRERAMGLIRDAINAVNAGIEYDRTH
ncbi:hypothetical protein BH10ACI2_BH10ACI2_00670 [soil metagenome]